ncbi:hypothetical protein O6H91_09G066300 [Diphasiastrum complanatum]|uniref:Uncharacterized protein n=1 Tax=Diphasiastrum complanatum TaxID=34168 RepID=A0ACC2CQ20_DIPCM|nr:hypothetical protein O6H91_09G066300 [Diphasiastrum complanatum]
MARMRSAPSHTATSHKWERRGACEEMPSLRESLGGFIFVCNNETMAEDIQRQLFGLPKGYCDSVCAIRPGLPLFLYNYSTHHMHGVFEASSDGGINLEPNAWEIKDSISNRNPLTSRFPAQVRVRLREMRPALEEDKFRPLLHHYDGRRFRLELTRSEAEKILKVFGASCITDNMRELQDNSDAAGVRPQPVEEEHQISKDIHDIASESGTTAVKHQKMDGKSFCQYWGASNGNPSYDNILQVDANSGETLNGDNKIRHVTPTAARTEFASYRAALKSGIVSVVNEKQNDHSHTTIKMVRNFVDMEGVVPLSKISCESRTLLSVSSETEARTSEHMEGVVPLSKIGCESRTLLSVSSETEARTSEQKSSYCSSNDVSGDNQRTTISPECRESERPWIVTSSSNPSGSFLYETGNRSMPDRDGNEISVATYDAVSLEIGKANGNNSPESSFDVAEFHGCGFSGDKKHQERLAGRNLQEKWESSSQGTHANLYDPNPAVNSSGPSMDLFCTCRLKTYKDALPQKVCFQHLNANDGGDSIVFPERSEIGSPEVQDSEHLSHPMDKHHQRTLQKRPDFHHIGLKVGSFHETPGNKRYDKSRTAKAHHKGHQLKRQPPQHSFPILQVQLKPGFIPLQFMTPTFSSVHLPVQTYWSPALQFPLYQDLPHGRHHFAANFFDHASESERVSMDSMLGVEVGTLSSMQHDIWFGESLARFPPPAISSMSTNPNLSIPSPTSNVDATLEALHTEILDFARTARPSPDAQACAEAAIECVREGVKQLWPGADIEVFGSFATGLCLPHSDIDIVVMNASPSEILESTLAGGKPAAILIRKLAAALREKDWCYSVITIHTASMPVIKLRCNPPEGKVADRILRSSVAVDITIDEKSCVTGGKGKKVMIPKAEATKSIHNGVSTRKYVIERLQQIPALAPLVLLMKSYLHHRGLNDVYTGGLGSFSLTLMLVFYLEQIPLCGNSKSCVTIPVTSSALSSAADSASEDESDLSTLTEPSICNTVGTSSSADVSSQADSFKKHGVCCEVSNNLDFGSIHIGPSDNDPSVRREWSIVDNLLDSLQSASSLNLGSLLIGFLHIFGQEIELSQVRIVLKGKKGSAGGIFHHEMDTPPVSLWIDDPFHPGANVGAGSFAMQHVQAAMRDMLCVLTRPPSVLSARRLQSHSGLRQPLPLLDQLFVNN